MNRLCIFAMIMLCMSMFVNIATAQKKVFGGTIRGEVSEATSENDPISGVLVKIVYSANNKEYTTVTNKEGKYEFTGLPAGRYTISFSKDGYGNRFGRSKVLAEGGEIYESRKLRKKETIATFLLANVWIWILFIGVATGVAALIIILILLAFRGRI